jgi:hypothetical protein
MNEASPDPASERQQSRQSSDRFSLRKGEGEDEG